MRWANRRGRTRRWVIATAVIALPIAGALAASAPASAKDSKAEAKVWADQQPGVQHLQFKYGPIEIKPGQNNIAYSDGQVPKPDVDGYIVGIKPNITYPDGKVPPVDVVHLHHGVWVNRGAERDLSRGSATFFAAGEEKTAMRLPEGYGYPYKASDGWLINYMIHDLWPKTFQIYITYEIDFVPASSPQAASITPARPIWMDVMNGSIYPVFDVIKGSGTDGTYTFPDQATDPYKGRRARNTWTVDKDSVLLATAGHLHPGGLHDDLWVDRASATPGQTDTAHLFESKAKYFEPAGAVSWDVAMTATPPDWRVQLHKGDVLRINTTYDSKRASWYESMGIMITWMTDGTNGADPFTTKVDGPGQLTHGHLPENDNHGGKSPTIRDVTKYKSAPVTGPISIDEFVYGAGDMTTGPKSLPTVKAGQSIQFVNADAPKDNGIWHSITACKAPCNKSTGIAYPLADGPVIFDSGQLGTAGPPTANTVTWQTPTDLAPGTYTYFCRIHPFMRGGFRVTS